LAVLWDFNGLQAEKTQIMYLQIFSSLPPRFSRIQDPSAPHSAASRHARSNAFSGSRDFMVQLGRGRVHGSDPDRENFEPSRYSGFCKELSIILPKAFGFRPIGESAVASESLAASLLKLCGQTPF
jgi:hypothetical protein